MTKRLLSSPEPNQMEHIIWQTGHHPVYFEKVNKCEPCSVMKMTNQQAELTPQFAEIENLHSLL